MKAIVVLMIVATVVSLIVGLVAFPALEAEVNRTRSNASYQEQQKLLAQAELERARAVTVTAKGEADALRMSINQPIALLAIPMALLALVAVAVLVLSFLRQEKRVHQPRQEYWQQPRTVTVVLNGKIETLYIPEGQDPSAVVQSFIVAASRIGREVAVYGDYR